jgi:hypothetical protein
VALVNHALSLPPKFQHHLPVKYWEIIGDKGKPEIIVSNLGQITAAP